jgi:hypothetical protein
MLAGCGFDAGIVLPSGKTHKSVRRRHRRAEGVALDKGDVLITLSLLVPDLIPGEETPQVG